MITEKPAVRGLLSVVLAAALFFLFPLPAGAEAEPEYRKIAGMEELTTGRYVLTVPSGHAMGKAADGCITACCPAEEAGVITDAAGGEWCLEVREGGAVLTDADGTSIAPGEDGQNGIAAKEYEWQVVCDGGYFSFRGFSGEEPVTLVFNAAADDIFIACKDSTLEQYPEYYCGGFALYRRTEDTRQWEEPEQTEPEMLWPEPSPDVIISPAGGTVRAGTEITLTCGDENAELYYALSADGKNFLPEQRYAGPICPEQGFGTLHVRAYALSPGCTPGAETRVLFTEEAREEWTFDWKPYFGLLHAHTNLSDGLGSVEEAFAYAADVENLDFFAVTDHSNSLENAGAGAIAMDGTAVSADWAAGKQAALAATNDTFVGIFGFEMSWQEGKRLGHLSTFNTPGWQSRDQQEFTDTPAALESYYKALASVPGSVSQFNHPGAALGDFEGFSHCSAEYDAVITLLEIAGEDGVVDCTYYNQALDNGWHVAPTNNQTTHGGSWTDSGARTVALAGALTEAELYDAMKNRRVYATQDSDLAVYYTLNGAVMGSVIPGTENPSIRVFLEDPTDDAIGNVEVVADGGKVVARQRVDTACRTLELSVPGGYGYYYLRITQPDGDIAVTAPVWLDGFEDMGIRSILLDTATPVRGEKIGLTVELYNDEPVDFPVEELSLYADGVLVCTASNPGTAAGMGTLEYTFSYAHPGVGVTELKVVAAGSVNAEHRTYEKAITLSFRVPEQVRTIAVDGSHGNAGIGQLSRLTAVAGKAGISVRVFPEEMPENSELLLITAPAEPFEAEFVEQVCTFARNGGTVILCGRADMGDWELHCAGEMNRLLEAIGATVRLNDDTAWNEESNGGTADRISSDGFNRESAVTKALGKDLVYSQRAGCTVDPGSGEWLVKAAARGRDTDDDGLGGGTDAVLLAWEKLPGGGSVYVSGGLFLADEELQEPDNIWKPVTGNQGVLETLLGMEQTQWPLKTIGEVRSGQAGQLYHIRGWTTSGTSRPGSGFENTVYLQDDTGGIALVPFTEPGVEVGTPMEAIGQKEIRDGNAVLKIVDYEILEGVLHRYAPETVSNRTAMDYEANGGSLLQVEGKVTAVTYALGGMGVARFTLKDGKGDTAEVLIEDGIVSEADGKNSLADRVKTGRTVRAIGILHMDNRGNPVLRVRSCDEVVYVPPVLRSLFSGKNPRTGDLIWIAAGVMVLSLAALVTLAVGKALKGPAKRPGGKFRSGCRSKK